MTIRIPNRTAQTGVYKTGSPDYVDVSSGTAVASMVTFSAKATDDSWSDSDTIGIAITKDASNYKVWLSSWDETNEYLELVTEEESVGTISDTDAVTVTAVLTQGTVENTLNSAANAREVLTADRTYYVRTDGSDSNSGLVDSAGGAFLTIQKAVDVACNNLDIKDKQVTIQVRAGTYTTPVVLGKHTGTNSPILIGDTTTPSNVVVSTTSASCISNNANATWIVKGFKLTASTSGSGFFCTNKGTIYFHNMDFGAVANHHIVTQSYGYVRADTNYTISGGGLAHVTAITGGLVELSGRTVTITGTPAFSIAFVYARTVGTAEINGNTFSGSATGSRYNIQLNSVCFVNGAGTSYLPGNSAGTTATGGQYA